MPKSEKTVRLEQILSTIMLSDTVKKDNTLKRKIAMKALCQLMLCPREKLNGLPLELLNEVNFFKDEVEFEHPFGGKV